MADNTTLPGTGNVIATDDVGGVHYQIVKPAFGALDTATLVSAANPFPASISQNTPGTTNGVQITALSYPQSSGNNSTVQLAAGATFTGTIETVLSLQAAQIEVVCDQQYTVFIDQFIDAAGLKLSSTYTFTRLAGVPTNENVTLPGNYMRVRVQNTGSSATTTLQLDTTFGIMNTQPNTLSQFGNFKVVAQENGVVSTINSTAVNLAASAVFTGAAEDVTEFSTLFVSVFASHASATDGLSVQFSADGTNWDYTDAFTIPAATGKVFSFGVQAKFFRLVYTNGGTLTTSLRIQSLLSRTVKKSSSQRPSDGRGNDNDFEEIIAYNAGFNGTSWDRLRSTVANGLQVDVTRQPALTKGTQGATGVSTQDLKDAGRNQTNYFMAAQVVSTATDTLQSLTGYKGGVAVTATTTPAVVTAAKTYRINRIVISYVGILTAGSVQVTLRCNLAGVVAIGSPAVDSWLVGANAATAGVAETIVIDFPDGIEFPAAAGIGVSVQGLGATGTAAAAGYAKVSIGGHEY